jgi:hypothetical protein
VDDFSLEQHQESGSKDKVKMIFICTEMIFFFIQEVFDLYKNPFFFNLRCLDNLFLKNNR